MYKNQLVALALCSIVYGCAKPTPEERFDKIEEMIEAADNAAAIIELKSLIQETPSDLAARKTLGILLFNAGDLGGAESQLSRVLEGGNGETDVVLTLKIAQYHQKKYESVLLLSETLGRELSAYESLVDYLASSNVLNTSDAKAFRKAKANGNGVTSKLLDSYRHFFKGDYKVALEMLPTSKEVPSVFTNEFSLYTSSLLRLTGKYDSALEYANEIEAKWPFVPSVAMHTIELALITGNKQNAESKIDKWLRLTPNAVWVNYFKGIIEAENQNFTEALNHLEVSINGGLDSGGVWLLNGLVASQLDLWETAYTSFETAYARDKNNIALSLLAETQLQLGENEKAIETIKEVISNDRALASPYVKRVVSFLDYKGRGNSAVELYEEYLSNVPEAEKNLDEVIQLEILKSKNGLPLASKNLELLLSKRQDSSVAQYLNIKKLLDRGNINEAREVGKTLAKKEGESVTDILALIEMYAGNYESAKDYALRKIAFSEGSKLAKRILFLALFELDQKEDAFKTVLSLAVSEPKNNQLAVDTIALLRLNDSPELENLFKNEISLLKERTELVTHYANLLAEKEKIESAIDYLESNRDKLTESGYQLFVSFLLTNENGKQAQEVAESWVQEGLSPKAAIMAKLSVLISQEKFKDASDFANDTMRFFEDDPRIDVLLFEMFKEAEDFVKAENVVERMSNKKVPASLIELFKSEIAISQKRYDKAIEHLENSQNLEPTYMTSINLAKLLVLRKQIDKAKEVMKSSYQQIEFTNARQMHSYAEFFVAMKDYKQAISVYNDMLKKEFGSPILFANLGEIHHKMGNMQEALIFGKKAGESGKSEFVLLHVGYLLESDLRAKAVEFLREGTAKNLNNQSELELLSNGAINLGLERYAELISKSSGVAEEAFNKQWAQL